ncbi:hypothetical protein [Phenylobacterium sp.]|uniref:hypothetical protein n=1 Tax=Phenylobacterium sp. TaxID=1871053 RepID=UPI002E367B83|nr:hypothetical protein [Phenylobacterium sp.]HEX2560720.1 hypothetical protein [Phenylobacterium sp.]
MPDPNPEPMNRQAGVPIGDGQRDADKSVATGDRRDEVRYEDDPAQLARVRHTFAPETPLPPQEQSEAAERDRPLADGSVTDVAEVKPSPSVWDARPPEN